MVGVSRLAGQPVAQAGERAHNTLDLPADGLRGLPSLAALGLVVGEAQDIPDLVRNLLASGERILAYRPDAFWLDMGNRADYERASEAFERNRTLFLPDGC